jgi:hypothetical protein
MSNVRILFRKSGGFTGISSGCDTSSLPASAASKAQKLLEAADLNARAPAPASAARDIAQYEITVHDGGKEKTFTLNDSILDDASAKLVDFLSQFARPTNP